ncbi:hypothetical protein [Nocardia africana]|uniref:Uncharacterized protein n=1 Tax=Nocardia africana TaxID=134964 RepID=A0A378WUE7_9NOCA|nr:hypothetical protein [Nocardia africana]MCC3313658.1 hypothetical protein [Nocardia africana]SUA44960.1 Uncharacterised protein [Nocardia africana]
MSYSTSPVSVSRTPIGAGIPYLRLADGTRRLLPEALRDRAITLLAHDAHHTAEARTPVFPCKVEFGVLHGNTYATPLSPH